MTRLNGDVQKISPHFYVYMLHQPFYCFTANKNRDYFTDVYVVRISPRNSRLLQDFNMQFKAESSRGKYHHKLFAKSRPLTDRKTPLCRLLYTKSLPACIEQPDEFRDQSTRCGRNVSFFLLHTVVSLCIQLIWLTW